MVSSLIHIDLSTFLFVFHLYKMTDGQCYRNRRMNTIILTVIEQNQDNLPSSNTNLAVCMIFVLFIVVPTKIREGACILLPVTLLICLHFFNRPPSVTITCQQTICFFRTHCPCSIVYRFMSRLFPCI